MNYHFCYLSALFLCLSATLYSQEDVKVRIQDFRKGKVGLDDAWKNVKIGDEQYALGGIAYSYAFENYVKASAYNDANPELNYKTGASALFSGNKEKAWDYLKKALDIRSDVAGDILLLAGHSLQYKGEYSMAMELLNKFLDPTAEKSAHQTELAKQYVEECIAAMHILSDTLKISIVNEGKNINSDEDDYSEVLSDDGNFICFASRRPLEGSGDHYPDGKSDENIFVASVQDDSWGPAGLLAGELTTKYCETPLYLNKSSDSLYVYSGYRNGGDVALSVRKKSRWSLPGNIKAGFNSKHKESSFCISPDGNEIYFVSDRKKDNIGRKDIYVIRKIGHGKWSEARNAGNIINSAFDEESVRLSASGDTLWFSSKGHDSMGEFDIFYAIRENGGDWKDVKNAGYPLNSQWDDLFYVPAPGEPGAFYFVSNRPGGLGGLDIYKGQYIRMDKVTEPVLANEPVK
jgi:tetratricopeptide (TPR) repeat protein